jgi:chemotaxis protein histidine kinase CheA
MDILNDQSMKEVVIEFADESLGLFKQLEETLENLEDNPTSSKDLENFGQVIDRVMGAAKSIGATEIATFCELGKLIGYKSSQVNDVPLLNVVVAILFDAVDLLTKMVEKIKTGDNEKLQKLNTEAFATRLKWLSDKFKDIERASCTIKKEDTTNLNQDSIDDLMASLGL